jgi:predicted nuclease of restriction endonuclease-like RecB superfamily
VLDALLWLDAERNHRLTTVGLPPSIPALAAAYNRRALATLLVRSLSADLILPEPDGAEVRRLFFLVKRNGLLCDLQLVDPAQGAAGGIHVHLYGPLEVFGPRTRHGDRFAGVLLSLLYRFPDLEGNARVLLNEREYCLVLGPDVADALGGEDPLGDVEASGSQPGAGLPEPATEDGWSPPEGQTTGNGAAPPVAIVARPEVVGEFDSDVEARLFATLQGMARRGDTVGWVAEREPEPLITGATVMVPDFALTRPASRGRPALRVFVEVIGFWTPAYRERKRDKLRQLAGRVELVLVVQEALAEHFQDLPFPVLTYKHRVSAADLIRLLSRRYAGPVTDAPALRAELEALLEAVDPELGLLGLEELRRALDLPAAGDLAGVLDPRRAGGESPPAAGWHWLPGVGMYHGRWLAALGERCAAAVAAAGGSVALDVLRDAVQASGLAAAAPAAAHLESLLVPAGYEVSWQSLFEATVRPRTMGS